MRVAPPLRTTVADVDLDAIAHNVAVIREAARAAVIAVVKADGYGHGAEAVSATAVESGVEMLAVFTVEEGCVLRRGGVAAPILALLGASTASEADAAVAAGLTLAVWDTDRARLLAEAARAAGRTVAVHFKVDTGLSRLGALPDEALARYAAVRALAGVVVDGIYTHLASADEPVDDATEAQLALFHAFLDGLGERPRLVHVSASAGLAAYGAMARCNAVRPGIALYGLHPAPHLAATLALRPALSWRSAVERVAALPAGAGVSYGHEYRLPRRGRVATIPVGYADGLPRAAQARGRVLLGGAALPFAGRVCMDLAMVDVTGCDVREGDEAVLIGAQGGARQTAEDLADACGTINYEIVTRIRARVPRRYLRGGRVVATKTLADGFAWA